MGDICRFCGRPIGQHSFNTRDVCNFFMERDNADDVRPDHGIGEGDSGGAGQGSVVSSDASSQENLRGFATPETEEEANYLGSDPDGWKYSRMNPRNSR